MKKVFVVGTVGLPACYGGFETLVDNLVSNASSGVSYTVVCAKPSYSIRSTTYRGANLIYLPFKANGVQSIIYDAASLVRSLSLKPDVILILGVSGCAFLPIFKQFSHAKVIVNVDGSEWQRGKWGRLAKAFLKLSERLAVRYADVVVSDNLAVYEYILSEYKRKSTIIAYGGDHAKVGQLKNQYTGYALALCRIEPENNVEMILDAFSKCNMKLKFVGNWNNSSFGKQLKNKYSKFENIDILDPIYDDDELFTIRKNSLLYVHGHSAGGTNPALVEMMFFEKPVFTYDCKFNRNTTENMAFYFDSSSDLATQVQAAEKSLKAVDNGSVMLEIASRRYTWKGIVKQYQEIF